MTSRAKVSWYIRFERGGSLNLDRSIQSYNLTVYDTYVYVGVSIILPVLFII